MNAYTLAASLVASLVCTVFVVHHFHETSAVQKRAVDKSREVARRHPHAAKVDIGQEDPFKKEYPELFKTKGQVVVFTATWCKPCRTQKIHTKALKGRFNVIVLDIDTPKGDALYKHYKCESVPTTLIVVEGELKHRFTGVTPASTIEQYAKEARKHEEKRRDGDDRRRLYGWPSWLR